MGVPCADDVMLNYQSTSYHDAALMRKLFGLSPTPEFAAWLDERGIFRAGELAAPGKPVLALEEILWQKD
jgi:ethanolamine ammonia-lyase large subunit